ncbi:unnamed protein product [Schistocephalus solidus]|uniref:Uncharacterized protein n=1 Tax=Schistocephalus solidus TaxID=70667 RepID=A0A3P7F3K3_SCHSO|nr:unnamed protein product [Schistocephalus solidus]
MSAPSQLHLPQHGVAAEDSGLLQDFGVRDPVLPFLLQYSAEAAEVEVIQLPRFLLVDGPGLRSVKACRHDDGLEHLRCGVLLNIIAIPHGGLQPAEDLAAFSDSFGNLVIEYF